MGIFACVCVTLLIGIGIGLGIKVIIISKHDSEVKEFIDKRRNKQ